MAGRKVGKGRTVFAAGKRYGEGDEIPAEVLVGDHVFTDAEPYAGNVPPVVDTEESVSGAGDADAQRKPAAKKAAGSKPDDGES